MTLVTDEYSALVSMSQESQLTSFSDFMTSDDLQANPCPSHRECVPEENRHPFSHLPNPSPHSTIESPAIASSAFECQSLDAPSPANSASSLSSFDPIDLLSPLRYEFSKPVDNQVLTTSRDIGIAHRSPESNRTPFLVILEEPAPRIRYRYRSEKGSHGGLTGENNSQAKKTYPTVKLENYECSPSREIIIKASLVSSEDNPKPHVHKLMGRNCDEDGNCFVTLGENRTAVFQNLGILFVGKKEVPEILFKRKVEEQMLGTHNGAQLTDINEYSLREEAEREAKDMNLNSVRVEWQAFDCSRGVNYPICPPVYSRSVANQKSPDSGELRIVRMDKSCGSAAGKEEVFLLCEKVNKKDIKVRFFEVNAEGQQVWQNFASFSEADVHHQVAIVFKTPPYRDPNIPHPVQVYLQLYRPKDCAFSEPRTFTYFPREAVRKRRLLPDPDYQQEFSPFQGQSSGETQPAQSFVAQVMPLFSFPDS